MGSQTAPRTLVIGATGGSGRALLAEPGILRPIRAMARTPSDLADLSDRIEVVPGDVLDRASVLAATAGVGTVISALGTKPWSGSSGIFARSARILIDAMTASGSERLVVITGIGAGNSRGHGPIWYDGFVRPVILRSIYADKEEEEALIRASALDWTIVRPATLVARETGRAVLAKRELAPGEKMGAITRAQVARFIAEMLRSGSFSRTTVNLFT